MHYSSLEHQRISRAKLHHPWHAACHGRDACPGCQSHTQPCKAVANYCMVSLWVKRSNEVATRCSIASSCPVQPALTLTTLWQQWLSCESGRRPLAWTKHRASLAADHLVLVVLAGQNLQGGLDDAAPQAQHQVEGRLCAHQHMRAFTSSSSVCKAAMLHASRCLHPAWGTVTIPLGPTASLLQV